MRYVRMLWMGLAIAGCEVQAVDGPPDTGGRTVDSMALPDAVVGGPDAGLPDVSASDSAAGDAGSSDATGLDAAIDGAPEDAGSVDATVDAAAMDAARWDAMSMDAWPVDARVDAAVDATAPDAHPIDATVDAAPLDAAPLCAPHEIECLGACVDPSVDDLNCGGCGIECDPGSGCGAGGCIELGCADGEREGFAALARFPEVAACSGGFAIAGADHVAPACGRDGGDDGPAPAGAGCNLQDLCAPGWSVCADIADFEQHLPPDADCGALDPMVGQGPTFISRQRGSNGVGLSCDGQGTNDLFGCGDPPMDLRADCGAFDKSIAGGEAAPWQVGPRAAFNTTEWQTVRKPGADRGGVLCCRRGPALCPAGLELCADGCVDQQIDAHHCGACDRICPVDQACESGECTCPDGSLACGGACVDPRTPENCGACGNRCADDRICTDGVCACPEGLTACGGDCVDLDLDDAHCGGCGTLCPAGTGCFDGACIDRGCADGQREGFADLRRFPDVAACSGGFDVAGLQHTAPACGFEGGDDGPLPGGVGCNVQDLCAPGWAVCDDVAEFEAALPPDASCGDLEPVADAGDRPTFVSRQRGSDAVGLDCDGQGTNDLFGCGRPAMNLRASCGPFDKAIGGGEGAPWALGPRAARNTTEWSTARKVGSAQGGALCCRRAPRLCPGGTAPCADRCVDYTADRDHCGACGNACAAGQGCLDGVCGEVGCADGQREGFADVERFTRIAACSGGFRVAGLNHREPACDRLAGDDGAAPDGAGCNVQDLCAPGWHACVDAVDVEASLPAGDGCAALEPTFGGRSMFVSRQRGSNTVGLSCDGEGTNDIFGCGTPPVDLRADCGVLDRQMSGGEAAPWMLGPRAAFNTTEWETVTKTDATAGGVLCCRDVALPPDEVD